MVVFRVWVSKVVVYEEYIVAAVCNYVYVMRGGFGVG